MARTILHADMDSFYAAIEQRDDAALRGRPVIVGGLGRRGVVSTASYEARRFGVHSAMPTARARTLCPKGIYLRPRMDAYVADSERMAAIFESFTPDVEPLSLDEAFLDVTGSCALFGDGPKIAEQLRRRVRDELGLTVSVGVAATKYVAKVASDLDKPDGLVVVEPGTERAFLAPLPVDRLWGAGCVTRQRLIQLGLHTIGDVQARSRDDLVRLLGAAAGDHFHRLAHGDDPRPVESDRRAKSISHETTFDDDLADDDACHDVLLRLCEAVGRRLRRAEVRCGVVRLKLRFPPFRTVSRQHKLDAPTDDDLVMFRVSRQLFDAARRSGQPVRLLGVAAAELAARTAPTQGGLFGHEADRKNEKLLRAMDAIRDRFGDDAIRHGGG